MFRILIHAAALIVINVLAIRVGIRWDVWVHQRHPFAAQLPLGALASTCGFLFWYHGINALDAGKWKLLAFAQWRSLYLIASIAGPICFFLVPSDHDFSKGRFLTVITFNWLVNALTLGLAFGQQEFDSAAWLRGLLARRWCKRLLAATGMLLITGVLVGAIEGICYVKNRSKPPGPNKVYEGEYLEPGRFSQWDPLLGTALVANADVQCRLLVDDATVWDVRYSCDSLGRRTTVNPAGTAADKYAIFFGCSFLFGEGANDQETIPSQFAAATPQYRAYNYGVPGYGTQQMLAKLESGMRDEIQEDRGIAIYVYLEDIHEPRVIGGMQVSSSFAQNFPYYDFDSAGQVQHYGTLTTGRPVTSTLYRLLSKSQFVRLLGMNFPRPSEDHYKLVAAIASESKKLCLSELNCDDFYVVLYPHRSAHRRVVKHLDAAGIKYFDYSDLFNPDLEEFQHVGDGHPTPKANRVLARRLASDLAALDKPNNE